MKGEAQVMCNPNVHHGSSEITLKTAFLCLRNTSEYFLTYDRNPLWQSMFNFIVFFSKFGSLSS